MSSSKTNFLLKNAKFKLTAQPPNPDGTCPAVGQQRVACKFPDNKLGFTCSMGGSSLHGPDPCAECNTEYDCPEDQSVLCKKEDCRPDPSPGPIGTYEKSKKAFCDCANEGSHTEDCCIEKGGNQTDCELFSVRGEKSLCGSQGGGSQGGGSQGGGGYKGGASGDNKWSESVKNYLYNELVNDKDHPLPKDVAKCVVEGISQNIPFNEFENMTKSTIEKTTNIITECMLDAKSYGDKKKLSVHLIIAIVLLSLSVLGGIYLLYQARVSSGSSSHSFSFKG